jgi:hypothetical protein
MKLNTQASTGTHQWRAWGGNLLTWRQHEDVILCRLGPGIKSGTTVSECRLYTSALHLMHKHVPPHGISTHVTDRYVLHQPWYK